MTIDLPICFEDVNEILQVVIANEKLVNPEITYQNGSDVGDGFLAVDTSAQIRDGDKVLNLFVKTAPKDLKVREFMYVRMSFMNEIKFYNSISPALKDLYHKKTGEELVTLPISYATNDEEFKEMIVMEHLKRDGFYSHSDKKFLGKSYMERFMLESGKFHATSFCLKDEQPEFYNAMSQNLGDGVGVIVETTHLNRNLYELSKNIVKYMQSPDDAVLLEKYNYYWNNLDELVAQAIRFQDGNRIIVHGDCHYKNILFKDKDDGLELRMIDFQGIKLSSPVSDLVYLFYSSASQENLANFHNYLDIYYNSLSTTIRKLGGDPEKIYPRSKLLQEWKIFAPFGLLMGFMMMSLIVTPPGETLDLTDMIGKPVEERNIQPMNNAEEYATVMKSTLQHLVDNDFL